MYRIIANNSNLHCVWGFLISQWLVMQYSLALQSLRWERKDWLFAFIVFWWSWYLLFSQQFPHGVLNRSVVCEYGIV